MRHSGIEAFLAIIRHGNVTDAAKNLYITQSTVSQRISDLEQDLGFKVINRGRGIRGLSLTAKGEQFLLLARQWEDLIYEMSQIESTDDKINLSIGAIDSVNSFILPPIYENLSKHPKNIRLKIKTYQSLELYNLLEKGSIDAAFTRIEKPTPDMRVTEFLSEELVIVYNNEGKTSNAFSEEFLDFSKQIYFNWGSSYRGWHEQWSMKLGGNGVWWTELDKINLLPTFMRFPENWSIVPLHYAKWLQNQYNYAIYHFEEKKPFSKCYLIENTTNKSKEALQILNECIEQSKPLLSNIQYEPIT